MEKASQGIPKREVLHFPLINSLPSPPRPLCRVLIRQLPAGVSPGAARLRFGAAQETWDLPPRAGTRARGQGPGGTCDNGPGGTCDKGPGGTCDIPSSRLSRELPAALRGTRLCGGHGSAGDPAATAGTGTQDGAAEPRVGDTALWGTQHNSVCSVFQTVMTRRPEDMQM